MIRVHQEGTISLKDLEYLGPLPPRFPCRRHGIALPMLVTVLYSADLGDTIVYLTSATEILQIETQDKFREFLIRD